jgi:hypothetical protein
MERITKSARRCRQGLLLLVLGALPVAAVTYGCGSNPTTSKESNAGTAGEDRSSAGTAADSGDAGALGNGGNAGNASEGSEPTDAGGRANAGTGGLAVSLAGSAGAETCGETQVSSRQRAVNVVVLLDRSGSMLRPYSTDDETTRWEAMRLAIKAAMESLTGDISVGLKLFPDNDEPEACTVASDTLEVPIIPLDDAVDTIDRAITGATPSGGTPIASAVEVVAGYLGSKEGLALKGDRVVLLATDGAPNCNASATCEAETCVTNIENPSFADNLCLEANSAKNCLDGETARADIATLLKGSEDVPVVRTIVVGIPGSDKPAYASVLEDLGAAGGLPNPDAALDYYPVDAESGVDGLVETLQGITKELIVSCDLELTTTPPDTHLINVTIDGAAVPQSGDNGWTIDASSLPMRITLKGATCEQLSQEGAESIVVTYGCPTVVR